MDTHNYITEGYHQLNNGHQYENLSEPIYPRTVIQITAILNQLKSTGAIYEEKIIIAIPFTSSGAKIHK